MIIIMTSSTIAIYPTLQPLGEAITILFQTLSFLTIARFTDKKKINPSIKKKIPLYFRGALLSHRRRRQMVLSVIRYTPKELR